MPMLPWQLACWNDWELCPFSPPPPVPSSQAHSLLATGAGAENEE